jgi:hypothetical protein
MRLGLSLLALLAYSQAALADCAANFVRVELTHFGQTEFTTHDNLTGVGQSKAARRLAELLKTQGYREVSRNGSLVIGWQGVGTADQVSALRFVVTGSGDRTRIDATLTTPRRNGVSSRAVRDELCRVIASAAG